MIVKYRGEKMIKKENYNKLIRLNIIFRIALLANIAILILILIMRKSYELNLTILKMIIGIASVFILMNIFKFFIQKIVLEECDYVSHLLYLNKIFRSKSISERTINQINLATTYLMLGKYVETKDILNKLNEKIKNVSKKNYIHIYILNLKYLAESGDKEAKEKFIQEKWNIGEYLNKLSNKQYISSEIEIWEEIIKQDWEKVILLIQKMEVVYESSKIVFTYWYAIANKRIGNMDIANENFMYVKVHGINTVYAELVEKENLQGNFKSGQSVVNKKSRYLPKIICCIYIIILIVSFALWFIIVHFNSNTETVLKKYNFTINQKELEKIYSESFDNYIYEIFVDPKQFDGNIYKMFFEQDTFYYCFFKKEGKYYRLLDCYVSDIDEIQEYKNFEGYLEDEDLDKVRIADMEFYVKKYIRIFEKVSQKEEYQFPCIGVYDDERIKDVEVEGKLPEIKIVKIQGKDWYIWKYNNLNYLDSDL